VPDDPQSAQEVCLEYYDEAVAQGDLSASDFPREEYCAEVDGSRDQPQPDPVDPGAVAGLEDGVAFGSTDELLRRVAAGGLGDDELFRRAVPEVDGASSVFFVDLQRALELVDERDDDLAALEALGGTSTGGSDGGFTVRLTVR
jgi:hypothetical protein